MMYTLKVMFMSGPNDGLELDLSSEEDMGRALEAGWEFMVGRCEECDVQIVYDTQVSREHAILRIVGDGVWLEDKNSRNGSFVGNDRIEEAYLLQGGELFRVGRTWLRIQETT